MQLSHLHNVASASKLRLNVLAMPFREPDWEDFQRDCDFFPAFTDYIYGVDTRPQVADEPGLHPQIYDSQPQPPQRLYGLPPLEQYPLAYDPVRDSTQRHPFNTPRRQSMSLLRKVSSLESMQPTPCPAPRVLPTAGVQMSLLRPNELITDSQYSYIPQQDRINTNIRICQAWTTMHGDAVPADKTKAMGYLKNVSRVAAAKRQEYQVYETAKLGANMQNGQDWSSHDTRQPEAAVLGQAQASPPYNGYPVSQSHQAGADAVNAAEHVSANHKYAIHDISQLPAYVQSRLPQLWACTVAALQDPRTDPGQLDYRRQAEQRVMGFVQSIPPKGRRYVTEVVDRMVKLRRQGGDPMSLLDNMPLVEDVLGIKQELQPGQVPHLSRRSAY